MQGPEHVQSTYVLIGRLISFLAGLIVLYCEYMGSKETRDLLLGVNGGTEASNAYYSANTQPFLDALVNNSTEIRLLLEKQSQLEDPFVAYLEMDNATNSISLKRSLCVDTYSSDYLYELPFVELLVNHVMVPFAFNLTEHWYIADCNFDGRTLEDTSAFKLFLLRKDMRSITTLFVQTVYINRPLHHRQFMAGAATFTTTELSTLKYQESRLYCTKNAKYTFAVGLTFPYDWTDFERIQVNSLVPPNGQWNGILIKTGEHFFFSGIEGLYRGSLEKQSAYNYYYWLLPDNPTEYMTSVQFHNKNFIHDSWGWFRTFLGIGITFNLGMNMVVAIVVMANLYLQQKVVWVADIYPSIQKRAMLRTILLVLDSFINWWWRLYHTSLNQGNYRLGLLGPPSLEHITRSDGLMVCLGTSYLLAKCLHVRVQLIVVVVGYMMCFYYRIQIVNSIGLFREDSNKYIMDHFSNYLIPGVGGMDLWSVYPVKEIRAQLIITEMTWLIVAIGLSLAYVLLFLIGPIRNMHHIRPVNEFELDSSYVFSFHFNRQIHWSKRSTLYDQLGVHDTDFTNFERSVGWFVSSECGFVAPTIHYQLKRGDLVLTRSGVWLLGFITLDDQFVIESNQIFYILINTLVRSTIFRVYVFPLDGNRISQHQKQLQWHHVKLQRLWNISLKQMC